MTQPKVLLISYLFPPCGESGVQRNLKYVKYLPRFGWKPYVLTVKDITYYSYDFSLLSEVPKEAVLFRTESFDPYRISAIVRRFRARENGAAPSHNMNVPRASRLLSLYRTLRNWIIFPDANLGWIPFAFQKGIKAIRQKGLDIVLGSVGPYSSAILGRLLSRAAGVPYVLDFRDGWTDDPYLVCPTRFHALAHRVLERTVVPHANGICVYGEYLRERFVGRYPQLSDKIEVLTNGFDPADFEGIIPAQKKEGWRRIVYCGSLYEYHTAIFRSVLEALRALSKDLLETLEFILVGRVEIHNAESQITENGLKNHVKLIGYVSHKDALSYLVSADALLLALPSGDVQSYSGKIFEYFMAKRPIVACIEPEGTCAKLLNDAGFGDWIVPPGNVEGLSEVISALSRLGWPQPDSKKVNHFSREHLTSRLANFLNTVKERYRPERR